MSRNNDLYVILEVGRTASVNDIKRAFRKLARRYHPDINPGDQQAEERFKRITEAYDVLSDPNKRQFYDVNGFYTDGVLEQHFSFQGFDFSSRSTHSEFSEIFGHVFSGRTVRRQPERGKADVGGRDHLAEHLGERGPEQRQEQPEAERHQRGRGRRPECHR